VAQEQQREEELDAQRHPHSLGMPEQQLRRRQQRIGRRRQRRPERGPAARDPVEREQQPGQVRDHPHHVRVHEVEQLEAGEREEAGAEQRGGGGQLEPAQQHEGPEPCERVAPQHLEVEGQRQRQPAIGEQVQRVVETGLSLAVQVEAGELVGEPEELAARSQRVLVEEADRQVEAPEIAVEVDLTAEERQREHQEEDAGTGECDSAQDSLVRRRRGPAGHTSQSNSSVQASLHAPDQTGALAGATSMQRPR
jgi:hypothetical protein